MIRYQFILVVFILIIISACEGDKPMDSANQAVNEATEVTKKAVNDIKPEVKAVAEAVQDGPESPKLREFYVEEDTSKDEPNTSNSKPSSQNKVESAKDNPTAKMETKPKPKPKKSPKLSFTNNTHVFGIIKPGAVIEHKFEFTNTGSADLVITDAKATCGCTQPSFPFVPIPPGEKGFIGVKYDSTGKLGTQKPTVTLTTNAYPKTQKVYLEGMVISELAKKQ